ncbi:hypothetical protein CC79DRAFT_735541 [Sarocladium strictum]
MWTLPRITHTETGSSIQCWTSGLLWLSASLLIVQLLSGICSHRRISLAPFATRILASFDRHIRAFWFSFWLSLAIPQGVVWEWSCCFLCN